VCLQFHYGTCLLFLKFQVLVQNKEDYVVISRVQLISPYPCVFQFDNSNFRTQEWDRTQHSERDTAPNTRGGPRELLLLCRIRQRQALCVRSHNVPRYQAPPVPLQLARYPRTHACTYGHTFITIIYKIIFHNIEFFRLLQGRFTLTSDVSVTCQCRQCGVRQRNIDTRILNRTIHTYPAHWTDGTDTSLIRHWQVWIDRYSVLYEISGCHGDEYEDGSRLGCCDVLSGRNWRTFQRSPWWRRP
jgi:hypothetical protein